MTGESPIVDIQSAQRQRVIDQELLEAIPTGRTPQVAAFMIPGVNLNNVDVGGTNIINTTGGSLSIHGGTRRRHAAARSTASPSPTPRARGGRPTCCRTWAARRKCRWTTRRSSAESITGGLQINMIPKTGGNSYSGSLFATAVNSSFEGSNNDDELVARGLRTPNSLKLQYDVNPGLGGPVSADKLWFYTSARFTRQANYVGGLFQNKNAYDITKWTYEPDDEQPGLPNAAEQSVNLRLTWQANADQQAQLLLRPALALPVRVTTAALVSQEAANEHRVPDQRSALGVLDGHAVEPCPGRGALRRPARGVRLHAEQSARTPSGC